MKTNDPDRLLVDGRQHVRAVGAYNHLQSWEGLAKQIDDLLLPTRMKVHVHLVDEQNTRGSSSGGITEVWVQAGTALRNVCDERNHVPYTVAECRQRQATIFRVPDDQRLLLEVPV